MDRVCRFLAAGHDVGLRGGDEVLNGLAAPLSRQSFPDDAEGRRFRAEPMEGSRRILQERADEDEPALVEPRGRQVHDVEEGVRSTFHGVFAFTSKA